MLSPNSRYLWVTTRAQVDTTVPVYMSAFLLDEEDVIVKQVLRVQTTTVGGIAHMISPAPWGDGWTALTDTAQYMCRYGRWGEGRKVDRR